MSIPSSNPVNKPKGTEETAAGIKETKLGKHSIESKSLKKSDPATPRQSSAQSISIENSQNKDLRSKSARTPTQEKLSAAAHQGDNEELKILLTKTTPAIRFVKLKNEWRTSEDTNSPIRSALIARNAEGLEMLIEGLTSDQVRELLTAEKDFVKDIIDAASRKNNVASPEHKTVLVIIKHVNPKDQMELLGYTVDAKTRQDIPNGPIKKALRTPRGIEELFKDLDETQQKEFLRNEQSLVKDFVDYTIEHNQSQPNELKKVLTLLGELNSEEQKEFLGYEVEFEYLVNTNNPDEIKISSIRVRE